jgi:hypothetical protein
MYFTCVVCKGCEGKYSRAETIGLPNADQKFRSRKYRDYLSQSQHAATTLDTR